MVTQPPTWPQHPGASQHPTPPHSGYTLPPQRHPYPYPYPGYRPPPPLAPTGEPLAEFTDRLLAYLVDWAIFTGVALVVEVPAFIAMMMYFIDRMDAVPDPDPASVLLPMFGMMAGVLAILLLATYIYEVEMTYRSGQTIGKRVMKIRVSTMTGAPLTRGVAAKRWLAYRVAALVVPGFSLLDGLWQLWDKPLRQCVHDKFATTVVVKCQPAPGTGRPIMQAAR